MTRDEEDAVLAQARAIEAKRVEQYHQEAAAVEARVKGQGEPFTDNELIYAAWARCSCGAGFAYPDGIGMHGAWYCSHLLKTRDGQVGHEPAMPFAFWSVRSEEQIARNNGIVTTRPEGAPWGKSMERSVEQENERRRKWQPGAPQLDLATSPVIRPAKRGP